MTYGWYQDDKGQWYYCHEISDGNLGALEKGWHKEGQDGKNYYFDSQNGMMLSGWQEIEGHSYYFATLEDVSGPTWSWQSSPNMGSGKWIYESPGFRSYGSMYRNEQTPDGQWVDGLGMKIVEQADS